MIRTSQSDQTSGSHFKTIKQPGKIFESRTVTLEPGAAKQVALGSYFISETKPEFTIKTNPMNIREEIGSSLDIVDIPGAQKFIVFYHLQNFSSQRCDITIEKRTSDTI